MESSTRNQLQCLPGVDKVLEHERIRACLKSCPRKAAVDAIRRLTDQARAEILSGKLSADKEQIAERIVHDAAAEMDRFAKPYYQRVVNAAGIVLHTGLGRAVLPEAAMKQIAEELAGYSLLQVGLADGMRSRRDERIEQLLQMLTGAEAATIVNNNAAATALVLNTIAAGQEVIVSRGQLVEIGGSFRLPEVMAFSGAKLVEVGTTNKTHLRDYENAITENTAAILRVHPSNYRIQGFTSEVPLKEMVELAHARGLVVFDDVGAGSLVDFSRFGFDKEPTLIESVQAGADVITSSGDKLIGATQAGIVLGRKEIIQRVRKNQFARIVRVDKFTLAALEATLKIFLDEEKALQEVPTLRMLLRDVDSIRRQALRLAGAIRRACPNARVETCDGFSEVGSGSLPAQTMPTRLTAVSCDKLSSMEIARRLRQYRTPVFARICDERVMLDPRTLLDGDERIIVDALTEILG
jgi:L-seryl-tRNA(Ser) seleniumtransferase